MPVMDGVERFEVGVRMRFGFVLGRRLPFAYEDPACFTDAFTAAIDIQQSESIHHSTRRWRETETIVAADLGSIEAKWLDGEAVDRPQS